MITFYSDCYRTLEIFPRVSGSSALLTLSDGINFLRRRARNLDRVVFPLQKYTVYTLSLTDATLSLAYLSDCDRLFDRGVRFLQEDGALLKTETPSATRYHFTPFCGPMYAPGALCFYRDTCHLFYPCAPFSVSPDVFCLGHAVSRDMLHWRHLPLCFLPPAEIRQGRHTTGGILGGCAVAGEDRVRLYLSYSLSRPDDGLLREYILSAESRDMLHFSGETIIPGIRPPAGFGPVFRNPDFTETADGTYILTASMREDRGVFLLFQQSGGQWQYVHPLLRNADFPLDYPNLFAIGRTHALLATWPEAARWYTGTFQNTRFRIRQQGTLDFGKDIHAPTSVSHKGRRFLFGAARHARCMTMPRELFTRAGRLLTRPTAEMCSVFDTVIYDSHIPGTFLLPATSRVRLCGPTNFSLRFGTFVLRLTDGKLCMETRDSCRCIAAAPLYMLELFADGPILEVFVNDGESSGTFHIPDGQSVSLSCAGHSRLQIFQASAHAEEDVFPDPDAPTDTFDFTDYSSY